MRRTLFLAVPLLLVLPALAEDDEWASRVASGARVKGEVVSALSSEGFTLGGAAHGWREDPALGFAVLRATVRERERRRDLLELARFALEERLFADARSVLGELSVVVEIPAIEACSAFHASGSFKHGALEVPLEAGDWEAVSFAGPFLRRLIPERILGCPVERPAGATLEAQGGKLLLRGAWPRAYGRTLTVLPGSETQLRHEGLPTLDGYFGFDLVTPDEAPLRALYAVAAEGGRVELQLVDARGQCLERATTRPLAASAKLALTAGATCRLLADGKEVARLQAASAFVPDAAVRVRPVLAVVAGKRPNAEVRFGRLVLACAPDPCWLERATAPARSRIRRELGLDAERFTAASERFALETDLGPASLTAFMKDLGASFAAFEREQGPARSGPPTSIRVFGAEDDYRTFVEAQGRGEEGCLGGFFDAGANAIVMRTDERSPRARLVHEAFHAYAAQALPELPAWLSEGLAERAALHFLELSPRTKRVALQDALSAPRSWRALVAASGAEFHDRAARRTGRSSREKRSYTLAWALCELAARKPASAASALVARALEAARAGDSLDAETIDEKALDAEFAAFAQEALR